MQPYDGQKDLYYVASYYIYGLVDPKTDKIFYIGQTRMNPKIRLAHHRSFTKRKNTPTGKYIQLLYDNGRKPNMVIVETIDVTCYIDSDLAYKREYFWVQYYKNIGNCLTNVLYSNPSKDKVFYYDFYLKDIENKRFNLSYYYCGSVNANKIYNEKRIIEDGFENEWAKIKFNTSK